MIELFVRTVLLLGSPSFHQGLLDVHAMDSDVGPPVVRPITAVGSPGSGIFCSVRVVAARQMYGEMAASL